jgi:hypothetical protein
MSEKCQTATLTVRVAPKKTPPEGGSQIQTGGKVAARKSRAASKSMEADYTTCTARFSYDPLS